MKKGARIETHASSARRIVRRGAFTLVEMLIVICVIGIVAAIALPKIDYDRYRVDAAGRVARNVLQNAQRTAILRQTNVIVSVDVTGRRMRIVEDANNNNTIDSGERTTSRPLEEGAAFVSPPITLGGSTGTAAYEGTGLTMISSLPSVVFLRDGAASADLTVYITAGRQTGKLFRAVRLTKATGRAEYSRFDGTTWHRGTV